MIRLRGTGPVRRPRLRSLAAALAVAIVPVAALTSAPAIGHAAGPPSGSGMRPVSHVRVHQVRATSLTLSWTNPSRKGFDGVVVREALGKTAPSSPTRGILVARVSKRHHSTRVTGLSPRRTYSFALFAHYGHHRYSRRVAKRVTMPMRPPRTTLLAGQTLSSGQKLVSADRQYRAVMQTDGNFVVYHGSSVLWATYSKTPGSTIVMQTDGNLVLYAPGGKALWFTKTQPSSDDRLVMQPDGNLVVYSRGRLPLWDYRSGRLGYGESSMSAGDNLAAHQSLWSANGDYHAVMQGDGDFVVFHGTKAVWASHTSTPGSTIKMQTDGNLVIYAPGGAALWFTQTERSSPDQLVLQNDGNLVVYSRGNVALWSDTGGRTGFSQDTMDAGSTLHAGQALWSANGQNRAIMQSDGNFVVYQPGGIVGWASYTKVAGSTITMQNDGNLVIYAPGGTALWSSKTAPSSNDRLVMQNDGSLAILSGTATKWSSGGKVITGHCNAFKGATALGGVYTNGNLTEPACGPRPDFGGSEADVYAYPGALSTPGYQCVELSERVLYYQYGVTMSTATNGNQVVDHYAAKYPKIFVAYSNGTKGHAPVHGDVLSLDNLPGFDGSDGGHTAVVQSSSVNATSGNGSIVVIEENNSSGGKETVTVSGWHVEFPGRAYVKWLHRR